MRVNPTPFLIALFAGLAFGWKVAFWFLIGMFVLSTILDVTKR